MQHHLLVVVEISIELFNSSIGDQPNLITDVLDEVFIVTDHQDTPSVVLDRADQSLDGLHI